MSNETQIAKLILAMKRPELLAMAIGIIGLHSNTTDNGAGLNLDSNVAFAKMLRRWAKGILK